MTEEKKWASPLAREAASQGKMEVAERYEEYHLTTRSDHPSISQAYGKMESFSINSTKNKGVGIPSTIGGKNNSYKDETGSYIPAVEYAKIYGWEQSPRGKRNAAKD